MYAGSKLVGPEIGYLEILHIIIAGSLASAGSSALNHYYDRDIDSKMKRTSNRPIPSGRSKDTTILIYGLAISAVSVIYAAITLNYLCTFFIALGIFFYVIIYTVWLKRLNSSNIVIGGFAGSAASMAGWSAATGSIDILGFLIGFLVFVWTPSHFWCLAMKLRDDYAEANVPMLPVLIGMERTSKIYSCKYDYTITIFVVVVCIWYGYCLYCNCCHFRRSYVSISLQANKNTDIRFCMEGIQSNSSLSYYHFYRNCTRCSFSLQILVKHHY